MSTTVAQQPVTKTENRAGEQLLQAMCGYMYSAAVYTVAKLKIADQLASGPKNVEQLAKLTGSNAGALYRVMRALAAIGIFAESPLRTFALTPVSEGLRSGVEGSQRDMVLWVGNRFHFHVWAEMPWTVQTGRPAVEHVYGKPCFDVMNNMPEVAADFNAGMTVLSAQIAPAVLEAYDFSGIGTLMDVAGGHGFVLCEVLRAYPQMKGILFDIESVIKDAKCRLCDIRMDHRCEAVAGNFYEQIPAGADAYYMQHILHDWDDEKCLAILANVRKALAGKKGGKLIVVDCVVKNDGKPGFVHLLDLEMLLMPGGHERTEEQWHELLGKGGFEITKIAATRVAESVIEAKVK